MEMFGCTGPLKLKLVLWWQFIDEVVGAKPEARKGEEKTSYKEDEEIGLYLTVACTVES